MDQNILQDRYKSVERLIRKVCAEFSVQHPIDLEDCLSEANEVFLKVCDDYRSDKGAKFSTYLVRVLKFRLMDKVRKEYNRNNLLAREDTEVLTEVYSNQITEFDVDDFIGLMNLSEDASIVVKLCLSNKFDSSMKKGQQQIRAELMSKNWTSPRCTNAFKEITEAINR